MTESSASIYDHGFLPMNQESIEKFLEYERLTALLEASVNLIPSLPYGDWAKLTLKEWANDPQRIERRIANLIRLLGLPDLGGVRKDPLDTTE